MLNDTIGINKDLRITAYTNSKMSKYFKIIKFSQSNTTNKDIPR